MHEYLSEQAITLPGSWCRPVATWLILIRRPASSILDTIVSREDMTLRPTRLAEEDPDREPSSHVGSVMCKRQERAIAGQRQQQTEKSSAMYFLSYYGPAGDRSEELVEEALDFA
jgi:hypothetical protein